MLKLDPNERATIPEIFGHPWVRGMASGCPPMDIVMMPARDRCDDGDEDLDFGITYSPTKVALPGSPAFLSPADSTTSADDKLPSIVSRSPSRIEPSSFGAAVMPSSSVNTGLGGSSGVGGTSLVPTGTPGTGRTRPGRIMDNPLQSKLSAAKMDPKHSPRPVIGALTSTPKSSGGTISTAASPLGSSSGPANFKRNPSSTGSSSRGRPRQGTANSSSSNGDKSHAERAAAHAGDSEKLPVAHQKSTRRRSDHADSEAQPQQHSESARGGGGGIGGAGSGHGLDSIGKKLHQQQQHGELTPTAAHN